MKRPKTSEWWYLAMVAIPFIYLFIIWSELPRHVPLHYNIKGEIDRWGNKGELILIPILLPLLTYLIMFFAPKIDPKKRIDQMGKKYEMLKFILVISTSALACYIIYTAKTQSLNTELLFTALGLLIAVLGNYMQTVKPNYFIGVKTPWTLENETIWKKTHRITGKLWMLGGISIMLLSFLIDKKMFSIVFIAIILLISIIPIIYSFILFKKVKGISSD